nr:uncharacterized protein LOC117849671 isoform X1 [Setaria viridis]
MRQQRHLLFYTKLHVPTWCLYATEKECTSRRGRSRGHGGGRGRGRGQNDQEVENGHVMCENNGNAEVSDQSAAGAVPAARAVPVAPAAQGMTFTMWTLLQVEMFDGSGLLTDAADWLRKVEKVMDGCRMTPEDKVFFIPHQLTSLADLWCDGVREAWPPARGAITWEVFLEQFRGKYYPESFPNYLESFWDRMSDALNHIQQGSKMVDEYEREFTNIVRFVPTVARDEREKARKFFRGLNARYKEVMGGNPQTTYLAAIKEARGMELEI